MIIVFLIKKNDLIDANYILFVQIFQTSYHIIYIMNKSSFMPDSQAIVLRLNCCLHSIDWI